MAGLVGGVSRGGGWDDVELAVERMCLQQVHKTAKAGDSVGFNSALSELGYRFTASMCQTMIVEFFGGGMWDRRLFLQVLCNPIAADLVPDPEGRPHTETIQSVLTRFLDEAVRSQNFEMVQGIVRFALAFEERNRSDFLSAGPVQLLTTLKFSEMANFLRDHNAKLAERIGNLFAISVCPHRILE